MLIIKPHHIVTYSKCPKKSQFSWDVKQSMPTDIRIIRDVIKTICLYQVRHERTAPWKYIPGWIDKYMDDSFNTAEQVVRYKTSKNILVRIASWYTQCYEKEYGEPSVVNLPVFNALDMATTYWDTIDILEISNKIRIFEFYQLPRDTNIQSVSSRSVYQDMLVHIRSWGFWRCTETKPDQYVRLIIGSRSIRPVVLNITDKMLDNAENTVRQITRGMRDSVFYPSINSQCLSCPYVKDCSI